jgi:hypothetical protein
MDRLLEKLLRRREMVPQLIEDFRTSSRNPFPERQLQHGQAHVGAQERPHA